MVTEVGLDGAGDHTRDHSLDIRRRLVEHEDVLEAERATFVELLELRPLEDLDPAVILGAGVRNVGEVAAAEDEVHVEARTVPVLGLA